MTGDRAKRRRDLAAIHIAKKDLGLSDESYRAVIRRVTTGRTESSASCGDEERRELLKEFERLGWRPKRQGKKRAGSRPRSADPRAAKARALWIALYHLGEVENPSEDALGAFVERQTGVEAFQWLDPAQFNQVIEALKSMCARAGFVVPDTRKDGGREAKIALLKALWAKLHDVGKARVKSVNALEKYLSTHCLTFRGAFIHMSDEHLDQGVEILGAWLRR